MDLVTIMPYEISQAEKDKYCMVSFIWLHLYMEFKKTNKQKTHRYRENLVGYQRMSELEWVNKMGEGGQL